MAHGPERKQRASPAEDNSQCSSKAGSGPRKRRGEWGWNYFRRGGVHFLGWLLVLMLRSRLQHLGLVCGLNLQGKPEVRESEVQAVGQITRKGPRGQKPGSRMKSRVQDGLWVIKGAWGPLSSDSGCLGGGWTFQVTEQDCAQNGIFLERPVVWETRSAFTRLSVSSTLLSVWHLVRTHKYLLNEYMNGNCPRGSRLWRSGLITSKILQAPVLKYITT